MKIEEISSEIEDDYDFQKLFNCCSTIEDNDKVANILIYMLQAEGYEVHK